MINTISLMLRTGLLTERIAASDTVTTTTALHEDIFKILEYYKVFINIFLKKKFHNLLSYKNHLNHHIFLKNDIKFIFNFIYNFSKFKLKILKNYINNKFKKKVIYSFISFFELFILFIKKINENLYLYIN